VLISEKTGIKAMAKGCVVWLTGLPGAGKTTIAKILEEQISRIPLNVEVLDGDEVRRNLSPELGFTKQDRETHAKRVVYLAKLLSRNGVITIVALISPYREFRKSARDAIGSGFVEVWVKASSETCSKRDPKGLYKKAAQGKVSSLTGVSDPYEPPMNPELVIDTESESADESARRVIEYLRKAGYLKISDPSSSLRRASLQLE
jgi:adenylylsulfate kinase